jgi:DNA-binding NtrC family response regulator
MKRRVSNALTFKDLSTRSADMGRVVRLAERAAKSNIPVLIEGESGVGKEVLARAIQGSGDRKGKPFITVNCGALPENLVESILFGHEKGAFTGATERHLGKFVEASGGTLFLDEIGELPLDTQVKLLRAIQEGEVDPVGGRKPVRVDIRLVSATNRSLIDLVKQGRFREDLYYRLNVFPIMLPPLRSRREDIPELARSFLARFAAEEGKKLRGLSAEAMALVQRYDWPGNVRQLENAMFRAVVLADGDELTLTEFPQIAAQMDGFEVRIPPAPAPLSPGLLASEAPPRIIQVPVRDPNALDLLEGTDMRRLEELEKEIIKFALSHYRGHMSEVSRKLGIGRSTLYRKLKDYGLADDSEIAETDAA